VIRVLLVDDQDLIRAGLRMLCEAQPDIEVVGEARTGSEAVRLADEFLPDVFSWTCACLAWGARPPRS
jgi:YesN/AraC family two-component response regulator